MILKYKDYVGSIQWDKDSQEFYGEILNIPDVIVYSGRDLTEIKETFYEAVDEYLVDAKQRAILTGIS